MRNEPVRERGRLALVVTASGSVNRLLLPTLRGLRDAGWAIDIVCAPGPIDVEVRDLSMVHFVPLQRSVSPGRDAQAIVRMTRLLRRIRPDVLVGATPKGAMIAMIAGRLARVPVRVFQVWGARWDGLNGRLRSVLIAADRLTAANATDVLSVSNSLAELMVANGACKDLPTVLGSGGSKGVDTAIFHPEPDYVFDPASPRIGFVGRLAVDKGIDDVLRIFTGIRKVNANARLTVIGHVDEAQPIAAETTDALTNDPAIECGPKLLPGAVAEAMRGMDLLLFPSVREGLPNAVIEAAACGVPTVGWDVTGVRDAVVHGETGYLVSLGDRKALFKAANLALTAKVHPHLREGAKNFARNQFSSEKVLGDFVDYLDTLLLKNRA